MSFLSDAEFAIAKEIWEKFGSYDKYRLRDYTHTLPEWKDPESEGVRRLNIDREDIAFGAGISREVAKQMADDVFADDYVDRLFAAV